MTSRYLATVFTPSVKAAQERHGSRQAYSRRDGGEAGPDRLGDNEAAFIATRDSFYMATTGAGGWPYVQHRGGAPGFVKVLDDRTVGIADFAGNRQYVSVGNIADDNRVALFMMDYPQRARLKLLGRARIVDLDRDAELRARLVVPGYQARVERGLVIDVEAFDWNCSQHITPRFTVDEITPSLDRLKARIADLEAEIAVLKGSGA